MLDCTDVERAPCSPRRLELLPVRQQLTTDSRRVFSCLSQTCDYGIPEKVVPVVMKVGLGNLRCVGWSEAVAQTETGTARRLVHQAAKADGV